MRTLLILTCILGLTGCFSEHPFGRGPDDGTATGVLPLENLSFANDIMPLLSTCSACHAAGAGGWVYDGGVNAYTQAISIIVPNQPEQSSLLINARGGDNHGGGTIYGSSSNAYKAIAAWISEGADNN